MVTRLAMHASGALTVIALAACAAASPAMRPEIPVMLLNRPAPSFSFVELSPGHDRQDLDAFKGKVVILDFWGAYCDPCKAELPEIEALYERHRADGLDVVAISQDEPDDRDKVVPFAVTYGAKFHVGWDEGHKIHALYTPGDMPSVYVIDRAGVVRYEHLGHHDGDAVTIEHEVVGLLGATSPP